MRNPLLAAAAAFALFPSSAAFADAAQAHAYKAQRALLAALDPAESALFVTTGPVGAPAVPPVSRRPVYIDGVLTQMDERTIRGQISAGDFTVVYPGTMIPWTSDATGRPGYPPTWY